MSDEIGSNSDEDMEINDFYISKSDKRTNLDTTHNVVYDIMIDFKRYVEDVSLPLIENLDYLYLFDYIDSLKS